MILSKKVGKTLMLAGLLLVSLPWAQPLPAPTTGDAPCAPEPTGNMLKDTVVSVPDDSGYFSLFDGTLKGWWQSCLTDHSSGDRVKGAAFRIGSDAGVPAIYSGQHSTDGTVSGVRNGVGGILMTNKIFNNYEIVFDFWPDFGNDGGLFNRTTATGVCFQTVLDYLGGGSVGGSWGEAGYNSPTGRDDRPFDYNGNENNISIGGKPAWSSWTATTAKYNPASYGCALTGCVQADYLRLWDVNGWNQMRVQFYGGSVAGAGNIHMNSWFRKVGATVWVPIIKDTTLNYPTPPGYIGFQVHQGQRFTGMKGSWYKAIKWRPMDDKGNVLKPATTAIKRIKSSINLFATPTSLVGTIESNFELIIQDLNGKTLERFSGSAGRINHAFKTQAHGWLSIQIKSINGIETLRIKRD